MTLSLPATIEAVLFAHGEPMERKRLEALLGIPTEMLAAGLAELESTLQSRGLALVLTDTQVELRTHPDAAPVIKQLRESELSRDLGKASLETLAIILYKGGATRSDVDWIRGVNSTAAIRSLLMRGLVERAEDSTDKRRARYTATLDALAHLGISRKEDLPQYAELATALTRAEEAAAAADSIATEAPAMATEIPAEEGAPPPETVAS